MSTIGIIQCRTGSVRLKKKQLLYLGKYNISEWVIRRVKKSKKLNKIILATSTDKNNKVLIDLAKKLKISHFAGSEKNVFSRFYKIIKNYKPNYVVRICADNPFIDPKEIDKLITYTIKNNLDYSFNHIPYKKNMYIDGVGAECIKSNYFLKNKKKINNKNYFKEHVTSYIWQNKNKFRINYKKSPKKYSYPKLRLDIDTPDDYKKIYKFMNNYKGRPEMFKNEKIINFMKKVKK